MIFLPRPCRSLKRSSDNQACKLPNPSSTILCLADRRTLGTLLASDAFLKRTDLPCLRGGCRRIATKTTYPDGGMRQSNGTLLLLYQFSSCNQLNYSVICSY